MLNKKFQKQLEDLINANGIDTVCNRPDYVLAEMVCKFLKGIANDDVYLKDAEVININEKGQKETVVLC